MATNHDGGNSDAVSPQRQSASDKAGNMLAKITTQEMFRQFVLGNYKGELPAVKWNECDGNIFSVLGMLRTAWRHTDRDVASRVAELSNFGMSGHFQNGTEPKRAELTRRTQAEGWGYDELLSLCMSLSTLDEDCDEDEDEDGGWDEDDEDCDCDDEFSDI